MTTYENNYNSVYGSFKVLYSGSDTIPPKEYIVKPLTQKELAEGWRLVLPYPKHRTKIFNNRDGTISRKKYPIYNRFNVNLAQLPNHLWDKLKFNYTDGKLTHFTARDRRYIYIVEPTVVDNEIRELREYVNTMSNTNSYNRVIELLQILNDNNIYGWVIIKAKKLLLLLKS